MDEKQRRDPSSREESPTPTRQEEMPEQAQQEETYVPRNPKQLFAARLGLILFILFVIWQVYQIYHGFQ